MRWLVLGLAAIVMCLALPGGAGARGWVRPVDGPVLRAFSVGRDHFAAGQHRGVDLAAPVGARIRSACAGSVSFVGRVPRGGLTVSVRCGRLVATYQHLGSVAVIRGRIIVPGALVGTAGSARPRAHVHLGARDRATGAYVDPLSLLAGSPRALPPPLPVAYRPLPPGPAPVARRPPALAPPSAARLRPVRVGRPPVGTRRLPWPVWLGLVFLGLGVPLGGLARARGRRRRTTVAQPQTAI